MMRLSLTCASVYVAYTWRKMGGGGTPCGAWLQILRLLSLRILCRCPYLGFVVLKRTLALWALRCTKFFLRHILFIGRAHIHVNNILVSALFFFLEISRKPQIVTTIRVMKPH